MAGVDALAQLIVIDRDVDRDLVVAIDHAGDLAGASHLARPAFTRPRPRARL